ncbi:MAG: YlxR family protein [Actinobacteria bacterium]|nr:YlxR family protein [Actinomycetota bacterium]MBV8561541.1 YlxR family protein [Actinomycetota bacterium]
MGEPVRRCAGCGRRSPQRELIRFAARDGELVADRTAPGRGVYTCRRRACFDRAVESRSFARVLRKPVRIEPELVSLYTDAGSVVGEAADARRNQSWEADAKQRRQ